MIRKGGWFPGGERLPVARSPGLVIRTPRHGLVGRISAEAPPRRRQFHGRTHRTAVRGSASDAYLQPRATPGKGVLDLSRGNLGERDLGPAVPAGTCLSGPPAGVDVHEPSGRWALGEWTKEYWATTRLGGANPDGKVEYKGRRGDACWFNQVGPASLKAHPDAGHRVLDHDAKGELWLRFSSHRRRTS